MNPISTEIQIRTELELNKYALVSGEDYAFHPDLYDDLDQLRASWDMLESDNYLKGGATFRQRRFGMYYFQPNHGDPVPISESLYFQSSEVNTYAGGIKRQFAPLLDETCKNRFLLDLIKFNFQQFPIDDSMADHPWEVDVHQFRIIGTENQTGKPTPEGVHHDGDDFNVIHLMNRDNVVGGENTIYDNNRNLLAKTTLNNFMDSVFVWDPFVMHGVSKIFPADAANPAVRDVIVIGYNHRPDIQHPEHQE